MILEIVMFIAIGIGVEAALLLDMGSRIKPSPFRALKAYVHRFYQRYGLFRWEWLEEGLQDDS